MVEIVTTNVIVSITLFFIAAVAEIGGGYLVWLWLRRNKRPKMDGFDLYKELRKVDPNVKVCFLTASEKYREDLRKGEYQTLSKDLFIQKPLSIKDLRKEIHKRIGLR